MGTENRLILARSERSEWLPALACRRFQWSFSGASGRCLDRNLQIQHSNATNEPGLRRHYAISSDGYSSSVCGNLSFPNRIIYRWHFANEFSSQLCGHWHRLGRAKPRRPPFGDCDSNHQIRHSNVFVMLVHASRFPLGVFGERPYPGHCWCTPTC